MLHHTVLEGRLLCPALLGVTALLPLRLVAREVRRPLEYPRHHAEPLLTSQQSARVRRRAAKELSFARASVGSGSVESEGVAISEEARRAWFAPVPRDDFFFGQLYARLWQLVNSTNEQFWRFALSPAAMELMQYTVYRSDDRGTYDWHEDVGFRSETAARVVSVSVQLSEPDAYRGGDSTLGLFEGTVRDIWSI